MTEPLILVGYGSGWLDLLRQAVPDRRVIIIEEPATARARHARAQLAVRWPDCDLYELEFQRPMAADLFHLWHPQLRASAVVPIDDSAVEFAARLAQRLGLPGAGPVPAGVLRDKHLLRQVAEAAGIPNPAWRLVRTPTEAAGFAREVGGPVVLKPTTRAGSSGVQIVADPAAVPAAWEEMTRPPDHHGIRRPAAEAYLAERRMSGQQFNVNLLVERGRVIFEAVVATDVAAGAHPVPMTETLTPQPGPHHGDLVATARRLVAATGFGSGFIHSEWIVEDGVPHLVECAGRLAGNPIMVMIGYGYAFDVLTAYLDVMSGRALVGALPQRPRQAAVMLTKLVRPGRVTAVRGGDRAGALPGVASLEVTVREGETLAELVSLPDAAARVITYGRDVAAARRAGQAALAAVDIVTAQEAG